MKNKLKDWNMWSIISYLREWQVWAVALAIFLLAEIYGCAPLRWDEKGVKLEHEISEIESIHVRCQTNILTEYECRSYYRITFNMEDLL